MKLLKIASIKSFIDNSTAIHSADVFLTLDKDMNGTLSKQELGEYADGTLTEIFIERGVYKFLPNLLGSIIC